MRGEDLARKLEITEVCRRLTLTQFNFKIKYGLGIYVALSPNRD